MRRDTHEALLDAQEHYRNLVELSPDGIAVQCEGRFVYANAAAASILGVGSPRALIGRPIRQFVHQDARAGIEGKMSRDLDAGRPVPLIEWKLLRLDGTVIDAELASIPVTHDGKPAAQLMFRDITERKRAERRLEEAETRYRTLVEQIPAVVYIDSLEGANEALYVSPQMAHVTGYSPEEWLADPHLWERLLHDEDRARETAAAVRHHQTGEPYHGVYRMFTRDGQLRWFRDQAMVVRDSHGVPQFCQGLLFDITKEKRAEEEHREAQELMEATLESTTDGILVADGDGGISFSNARFAELWRIPPQLLARRRSADLLAHVREQLREPAMFITRVRELYDSTDESFDTLLFRDGRIYERYSRPLKREGKRAGRVWSFRDVTQRKRAEEELFEAEVKYRALVEHIPAILYVDLLDDEWTSTYVSPQIERIVGITPSEYLARPGVWVNHLHPEDRNRAMRAYEEGRKLGEPFTYEYRMIRPDGSVVWIEEHAVVLRDESGAPTFLQGIMFDVTPRKEAERAVHRQNELLAALHETTLGLVNRLDLDDLLGAIVTRAGSLVGTTDGYLYIADPDGGLVARVGTGAFRPWVGFHLNRGEGVGGIVWDTGTMLRVDDYDTWDRRSPAFPTGVFHAVAGVPLFSGGEVIGVIGLTHTKPGIVFTDEDLEVLKRFGELASICLENARLYNAVQSELGERTRAEQALRFQAQLLATVRNAVIATDAQGVVTYWNSFAEELFGLSAEVAMGRPVLEVIVAADGSKDALATAGRALDGIPWTGEFELLRSDGSSFTGLLIVSPIRDAEGSVIGTIGVTVDVTERKRAEEALVTAFEHEKEITQRLRALDEMKNTFLHAVSHELRTPLAAVLGLALTLDRPDVGLSPEETRELIHRLASNARKLDQLLSDLLDLDRLDRGILEPRRHPTDISALVRRVVQGSDVLGERPIRVETELVVVAVDAPKVERIVENLLANAARHTPPGATVWVRVRPEADGALIVVDDEGPGVPEEFRQSIFEPFVQGPAPPSHSPGVGVGLSLVSKFAELHGGRAWVEPREEGGASFRVYLPAVAYSGPPTSTGTPTIDPYSVQDPS